MIIEMMFVFRDEWTKLTLKHLFHPKMNSMMFPIFFLFQFQCRIIEMQEWKSSFYFDRRDEWTLTTTIESLPLRFRWIVLHNNNRRRFSAEDHQKNSIEHRVDRWRTFTRWARSHEQHLSIHSHHSNDYRTNLPSAENFVFHLEIRFPIDSVLNVTIVNKDVKIFFSRNEDETRILSFSPRDTYSSILSTRVAFRIGSFVLFAKVLCNDFWLNWNDKRKQGKISSSKRWSSSYWNEFRTLLTHIVHLDQWLDHNR